MKIKIAIQNRILIIMDFFTPRLSPSLANTSEPIVAVNWTSMKKIARCIVSNPRVFLAYIPEKNIIVFTESM